MFYDNVKKGYKKLHTVNQDYGRSESIIRRIVKIFQQTGSMEDHRAE